MANKLYAAIGCKLQLLPMVMIYDIIAPPLVMALCLLVVQYLEFCVWHG
jgi:hypothetical protein